MKSTIAFFTLLSSSLLPLVAAHGYVRQLAIDGKLYRGNIPRRTNFDSPIRAIDDSAPVKGATNRAMNCGPIAPPAKIVAPANPGSRITFDWAGGDDGLWPHNTGPMLTYLASCGNTSCSSFDAINARWFKIDEAGLKSSNGANVWFQQDIMEGKTYTTTLPTNLAPGEYLVRHEIIGLHIAGEEGGAEFYPSCSQIKVGGTQTGVPSVQSLVEFPGAYSDTEPGILVNAFDTSLDYQFPGPAIDPALAAQEVAITAPAPPTNGLPDPAPVVTSSAAAVPPAPTQSGVPSVTIPVQPTVSASSTLIPARPSSSGFVTSVVSSASVSATATATATPTPFTTLVAASPSTTPLASESNTGSGSGSDAGSDSGLYNYKPRRLSRVMLRHLEQI